VLVIELKEDLNMGLKDLRRSNYIRNEKEKSQEKNFIPDPRFGSVTVTRFVNNLMLTVRKTLHLKCFILL
jgi:hypothetical protein